MDSPQQPLTSLPDPDICRSSLVSPTVAMPEAQAFVGRKVSLEELGSIFLEVSLA